MAMRLCMTGQIAPQGKPQLFGVQQMSCCRCRNTISFSLEMGYNITKPRKPPQAIRCHWRCCIDPVALLPNRRLTATPHFNEEQEIWWFCYWGQGSLQAFGKWRGISLSQTAGSYAGAGAIVATIAGSGLRLATLLLFRQQSVELLIWLLGHWPQTIFAPLKMAVMQHTHQHNKFLKPDVTVKTVFGSCTYQTTTFSVVWPISRFMCCRVSGDIRYNKDTNLTAGETCDVVAYS